MKEQTLLTSYGRITLSNARQILEQMDRDAADLQRRIAEFNPQPHPTFCQWLWSLVTTRHTRR